MTPQDEAELRYRCNEVAATADTKGWPFLEAEWFVEREKIIALGKKAVEERDMQNAAFCMAELAGFDRALKVPEMFKKRFQEFLQLDKERRDEKSDG